MAIEVTEEGLRKLRGHLAHKNQCPPYIIFPDEAIPLLMEAKPKTLAGLSMVKGFPDGGERNTKWGREICRFFKGQVNIPKMDFF